jgi:hypothetical protein
MTSACWLRKYGARRGQVGNFPNAASHLTLIGSATAISTAEAMADPGRVAG